MIPDLEFLKNLVNSGELKLTSNRNIDDLYTVFNRIQMKAFESEKPSKMSGTCFKKLSTLHHRAKDVTVAKTLEHVLEAKDDVGKAMNILIHDSAFYRPLYSEELWEAFVAISLEVRNKIQLKPVRY